MDPEKENNIKILGARIKGLECRTKQLEKDLSQYGRDNNLLKQKICNLKIAIKDLVYLKKH